MGIISESGFKSVLNTLWSSYGKAMGMINTLYSIGLEPHQPEDQEVTGLNELYGIRDKLSKAVLDLTGIDSDAQYDDGDHTVLTIYHPTIMEKLDLFFEDAYDAHPHGSKFPEEFYDQLIEILTKGTGAVLPWDETLPLKNDGANVPPYMEERPYRRHRAIAVNGLIPVTGYLWAGSSCSYIIPDNSGISHDNKNNTITAPAEMVYKDTVAVEMLLWSDDGVCLFEGDTVRIGDDRGDTFVLRLSDMNVLRRLVSKERKEKGLYLVKRNYEDFLAGKKGGRL